ncbi:lysophospholipid acyltransferase family protein [Aporhodopirellula aestuarii]|uniref:Lysophospholipid acyltransferase family protein n=1 Tax=Aporhodopirellula aestuarii TaxID=2950107 RepID=A0ABT0U3R0_9BACT|nr:lysophospholipid acyltransferase family protein [Aporhodopirellula aestuarii]MCM2371451.1 lysophospholipid acyltransferase family protein [Aporhodopirellula aestuarii]
MRTFFSWLVAITLVALRWTCRVKVYNDIRPVLRQSKTPYVFAVLHAHQFAALMVAERGLGAMVSRSADGEMIVPSLMLSGCVAVRGSSGQGVANRGGRTALRNLIRHVCNGRPACLTVDGPRGPRGRVHKGIGDLSRQSGAVVLAAVVVPRRRWIVSKAWDRMQVPKPFTTIELHFSEPLKCGDDETLEAYRRRIQETLAELESIADPEEFPYTEPRLPAAQLEQSQAKAGSCRAA